MRRGILAIVVVIIVATGVAVYASARLWHYTQHDPAFCRSCHLMESAYERWQQSVHSKVDCHACHMQSMRESLDQLVKYVTLRPTKVGKHAEVDYHRCGECHLSRDPRWKQVAETAGHKVHFARLGLECVGCHSKGVHRFVRPTDACKDCHTDIVMKAQKMEALHCTACHGFLATGTELKSPTRQQCLDCHGALTELTTFPKGAPMRFACNQCHKPHQQGRPMSDDCRTCHQMQEHGLHAQPAHAECVTCHAAHTWKPSERATCEACHSDRHQHYADLPCASCHSFAAGAPIHLGG